MALQICKFPRLLQCFEISSTNRLRTIFFFSLLPCKARFVVFLLCLFCFLFFFSISKYLVVKSRQLLSGPSCREANSGPASSCCSRSVRPLLLTFTIRLSSAAKGLMRGSPPVMKFFLSFFLSSLQKTASSDFSNFRR